MTDMQGMITGRIVHYVLNAADVDAIYKKRQSENITGNPVHEGVHVPAVITAVFPDEFGPGEHGVNLKCFLDGDDLHWVVSRKHNEGKYPGAWHWIEKA